MIGNTPGKMTITKAARGIIRVDHQEMMITENEEEMTPEIGGEMILEKEDEIILDKV